MSRELGPGECTQLCLGAELPGSWHRHRREYHLARGYGTSLSMDCKYGLWIQGLWSVIETPSTESARKSYVNWLDLLGSPSAAPLSLSGKRGGKSHLETILISFVSGIWRFCMVIRSLLLISMKTTHDPKEPVFLIALKIMRHAMSCLSVIVFLICVCWHPERICRALSTCGQRGQVWLVESLNNTACFWLYRVPILYFIMMYLAFNKGTSDDVR